MKLILTYTDVLKNKPIDFRVLILRDKILDQYAANQGGFNVQQLSSLEHCEVSGHGKDSSGVQTAEEYLAYT
eukprot:gene10930-3004_t